MPEYIQSPIEGTHLFDDFVSNDLVTDNNVGAMKWQITAIANGTTYTYVTAEAHGVLRSTTVVTADGDGSCLHSFADGIILNGGNGHFRTRVRYPNITGNAIAGNNFRIGLDDSVTATSPTVGIWIDANAAVLTLQCDSADHGDVAASAAGVSTLTSGTTMVLGTWHEIDVFWSETNAQGGPLVVKMFVDNELAATVDNCAIDNDEEVELKIAHWQDSGSGDTLDLDIDYFEVFLPR